VDGAAGYKISSPQLKEDIIIGSDSTVTTSVQKEQAIDAMTNDDDVSKKLEFSIWATINDE
jgi:hypothetical protein